MTIANDGRRSSADYRMIAAFADGKTLGDSRRSRSIRR
jgi:hypothetical protein